MSKVCVECGGPRKAGRSICDPCKTNLARYPSWTRAQVAVMRAKPCRYCGGELAAQPFVSYPHEHTVKTNVACCSCLIGLYCTKCATALRSYLRTGQPPRHKDRPLVLHELYGCTDDYEREYKSRQMGWPENRGNGSKGPDSTCKWGHTGHYKLNSQGAWFCQECVRFSNRKSVQGKRLQGLSAPDGARIVTSDSNSPV